MADYKRGRALKQLQLAPQENKQSGEKGERRPTQKEPERKRRDGSRTTAEIENRIMKGAGLGDLRSEDRQRLRQLIQDLALAESEKEEAEERLKKERKDHDQQLSVLRARQAALVKDKGELEHRVKNLQQRQKQNIAPAQQNRQLPETESLHSRYKRQQILLEHQQHLHQVQKRQIEQQLQLVKHHQASERSSKHAEDQLKKDSIRKQEQGGGGLFYGGRYPSWSSKDPLSTHQPSFPAISSHLGGQSLRALSDSMCSLPQIGADSQVNTNPQSGYQQLVTQNSSNLSSSVTLPSSNSQVPTTQNHPAMLLPRPANPTPPFLLQQANDTAFLSTLDTVSRELYNRPVTRKTAKVNTSETCTSTSSHLSSPPKLTHEVSVQVTALENASTQTDTSFEPTLSESQQSPSLTIPSSPVVTHEVSVQVTGLETVSTQTSSHTSHPLPHSPHPHKTHSHTTHFNPHLSHPHTSHSHPHSTHPHTSHPHSSHPHTSHSLPHLSHNLTELQSTENDLESTLPTSLKEPTKHSSPVTNSPIHNQPPPSKNSSTASSDGERSSLILGDSAWRHTQSRVVVSGEKEEEEVSVLLNQGCRGVDALAAVREARLQDSLPEPDDEELLEELFFISTNER